jgi:hypothetical protein
MNLGLAAWHRAMAAGTPDHLLSELIAEDAVFHSPVVHTPQAGRAKVMLYPIRSSLMCANWSTAPKLAWNLPR